jgi:hypothetical protein
VYRIVEPFFLTQRRREHRDAGKRKNAPALETGAFFKKQWLRQDVSLAE